MPNNALLSDAFRLLRHARGAANADVRGAVNAARKPAWMYEAMSELGRLKEQLVYLRFWLGIMVVTEIPLVGWLISTPTDAI